MTQRKGFTLVELLVVIGVIAVLIAILLPAMNKARYAAKMVACKSNLRQLGMSLSQYAAESRNHLPLFYWWGIKGDSAKLNTQQARPAGAGPLLAPMGDALVTTGIIKSPKAFFCPLETTPSRTFEGNVWPMKSFTAMTLGYSVRPVVRADPIDTIPASGFFTGWYMPFNGRYPKTTDYRPHQAIAADVMPRFTTPTSSLAGVAHLVKGVHVQFLDGSVQFVPYKVFAISYNGGTNPNYSTPATTTVAASGIWFDFDKDHN